MRSLGATAARVHHFDPGADCYLHLVDRERSGALPSRINARMGSKREMKGAGVLGTKRPQVVPVTH